MRTWASVCLTKRVATIWEDAREGSKDKKSDKRAGYERRTLIARKSSYIAGTLTLANALRSSSSAVMH